LILDEPTAGLDPIGTKQIKDLIIKLAQRGKTILLCSHLLADVEDVCDRIAILYGGKIQTQGQVRELLQQTNKRQIVTDAISDTTVEKIKELVHSENASCEISSPMDKLETFFIRTVETAQKQAQATSGAVSTTKIGDFLTQKAPVEKILDKLVSASVSQETSDEPPATDKVVQTENVPEPDEQMLTKLSGSSETVQAEPVSGSEQVETEPVESDVPDPEQIKKNVLDNLTGNSDPNSDTKENDEQS